MTNGITLRLDVCTTRQSGTLPAWYPFVSLRTLVSSKYLEISFLRLVFRLTKNLRYIVCQEGFALVQVCSYQKLIFYLFSFRYLDIQSKHLYTGGFQKQLYRMDTLLNPWTQKIIKVNGKNFWTGCFESLEFIL
jgi:hypothetical protein